MLKIELGSSGLVVIAKSLALSFRNLLWGQGAQDMAQAEEVRGRCRGVGYLWPSLLDSGCQDYESSALTSWAVSLVPSHPLTSLGELKISCRSWDGVSTTLWEQSLVPHEPGELLHLSTWVAAATKPIGKARTAWAAEAGLDRAGLEQTDPES